MMADGPKMRPVSWTMSAVELKMLDMLIRRRRPTDPKAASLMVRECIRETFIREFGEAAAEQVQEEVKGE